MVRHFLLEAKLCNPAAGREKRQIGKDVWDTRNRLRQPMPGFLCLAALTTGGDALPGTVGPNVARLAPRAIVDVWAEEVAPVRRLRQICQVRVVDVPGPSGPRSSQYAGVVRQSHGQPAGVSRAFPRRRRAADRVRASPRFARFYERKRTTMVYDCLCYLAVIQRMPRAQCNGRAFRRTAAVVPGSSPSASSPFSHQWKAGWVACVVRVRDPLRAPNAVLPPARPRR
jgi:hypothetical protein